MLWKCIEAVHKGQVWANSVQLQLLLSMLRKTTPVRVVPSAGTNLLAQREGQVATLVAEGLPNKEIALKLGITEHTVSNYLFRIYNKLGISSRVELVLVLMKRPDIHRGTKLISRSCHSCLSDEFRHIQATSAIVLATDLLWKCIDAVHKAQV